MILHHNQKLFSETIRSTSEHLKIIQNFIEKDYWITLVLNRIANSSQNENIVFKGGTSLSKAYKLINRFSEDVDIAVNNVKSFSGNQIKTLIRDVEKEMTSDLREIEIAGTTSKGSRFRKSVFEYQSIDTKNIINKLIVEVNSFANPYPFLKLPISSFIHDFLMASNNEKIIEEYKLQPFELNILDKRQTLLEKLVSLIRFSFDENTIESVGSKIRHFYDIYYLLQDDETLRFVKSEEFIKQFYSILNHDKISFEIPVGWNKKPVSQSPLVTNFPEIWFQLKDIYKIELSALAFAEIPDEKEVAEKFGIILRHLI